MTRRPFFLSQQNHSCVSADNN